MNGEWMWNVWSAKLDSNANANANDTKRNLSPFSWTLALTLTAGCCLLWLLWILCRWLWLWLTAGDGWQSNATAAAACYERLLGVSVAYAKATHERNARQWNSRESLLLSATCSFECSGTGRKLWNSPSAHLCPERVWASGGVSLLACRCVWG